MLKNEVKIGLLWHSMNSDNLGVGALTVAHIEILDGVAKALGLTPRYVILCWDDPRPPYFRRDDIEIRSMRMKQLLSPGGFFRQCRDVDLVLDIGAGDSFADIYGPGRIRRMFLAQALVLAARRPLVFSPQTIGPFTSALHRRIAFGLLRRAAIVAARDRLSLDFLRGAGYAGAVVEASDVALRLPAPAPAPRTGDGRVRVGLNVSGLLFNGGYSKDNMFGLKLDYAALMGRVVDRFLARPEVELHLVSHVISDTQPVEDDHAAAMRLSEGRPGVIVAPRFADPSAAKAYIAGMDFFAGARMHACVAAFSTGVPVVPLAYSRKFEGLFGAMGYDHVADCRALDAEAVLALLESGYENRVTLKADAEAALARGLGRLAAYERAVSDLIRAVARARA